MPKYRLKMGTHATGRGELRQVFRANDPEHNVMEMTKQEAERFAPGRLEPLSADEAREESKKDTSEPSSATATASTTDTSKSKTAKTESDWSSVLSQGVNDVRAMVVVMDDPAELTALQKEEEKGGNRKMVLDAIAKRQEELKK